MTDEDLLECVINENDQAIFIDPDIEDCKISNLVSSRKNLAYFYKVLPTGSNCQLAPEEQTSFGVRMLLPKFYKTGAGDNMHNYCKKSRT